MSHTRVGILGIGHIGSVHLQSACAMEGVTVVAAADAESTNRAVAEELGVPRLYEDYAELLHHERLDAVVIALPPFLHEEAAIRAAEVGCDVFVEKPLARSTEEARRIIAAADDAGVALGVDHTLRYQSDVRALKAAYDDGRIGAVPLCHLARINSGPFDSPPAESPLPEWQLDPEATGGGAVMDLGVHLFDLLEWLFGDITVRHVELERQLHLDYEDTAAVVLKSSVTGTLATVHCGFYQWEEPPDVNMRLRLDGVTETIDRAEFVPEFYRHAGAAALRNAGKRLIGNDPDYFEPTYYYRAHFEALQAFLDAVAAGQDPPVDGADGLRAIELVEETYRMAEHDGIKRDQKTGLESKALSDGGDSR